MNLQKTALALLAALLMTVGVGLGAVANSWITPEVKGSDVLVSGCVIRFADGYPSIYANGAHQCAGIKDVKVDRYGDVEVTQTVDDPAANPVLFAQCQADETLGGRRGIICGASGGTGDTSFLLYDTRLGRKLDLNKATDRQRVQGQYSNLWIGFFHVQP